MLRIGWGGLEGARERGQKKNISLCVSSGEGVEHKKECVPTNCVVFIETICIRLLMCSCVHVCGVCM